MLYFIVTASLFKECRIRRSQYTKGINRLKQVIVDLGIENYRIVIVENTGNEHTFLDSLNCTTFYTTNNSLETDNKGYKELQDVLDCIDRFNISDTDFIVKMTGRYILENESEFMHIIQNINNTKYDCVIKYGSYHKPVDHRMNDCITGLIGMTCGYVKRIEKPLQDECVEWQWAKVTYLMEDEKVHKVNRLGISICPGSDHYFKV